VSKPLPQLSALQFIVLDTLGRVSPRAGSVLRRRINRSGPAFYQLMARLEKARFVAGRKINKQKFYRIMPGGREALAQTVKFYCHR
jgi:DNA-binding PadR family transcriptional regulator